MNRPLGVTVLAGLQFFYSGFGLLMSLAVIFIPQFRQLLITTTIESMKLQLQTTQTVQTAETERINSMMLEAVPTMITVGGIIGIVFAIVGGLLGYGLLKQKQWAWILTLIVQIFQALGTVQVIISSLIQGSMATLGQMVFQLAIISGILYYLFRPEVRQAFKRPKPSD
jgi:hypothetical protein